MQKERAEHEWRADDKKGANKGNERREATQGNKKKE